MPVEARRVWGQPWGAAAVGGSSRPWGAAVLGPVARHSPRAPAAAAAPLRRQRRRHFYNYVIRIDVLVVEAWRASSSAPHGRQHSPTHPRLPEHNLPACVPCK